MNFWENAYKWGWADADLLRLVVKTDANPFGEITVEDFERITGQPFADAPAEPAPEENTEEEAPEEEKTPEEN